MKPIPTDRTITYQLQYRTCRRPHCHCRVAGTRHGPYWYAYWRDHTGKVRSTYIGKNLPSTSREGDMTAPPLTQEQTGIGRQGAKHLYRQKSALNKQRGGYDSTTLDAGADGNWKEKGCDTLSP